MTHTTSSQVSIQAQIQQMFDAAAQQAAVYRKPAGKKQQTAVQQADRSTVRRAAVAVIDSRLRSFKATVRAIWDSRQSDQVILYLADKKVSIKRFSDYKQLADFLKAWLPVSSGSYAVNKAGQLCKAVVSVGQIKPDGTRTDRSVLHQALGWDIIPAADGTSKALQPLAAWSVADLINCTSQACRAAAKASRQPAAQTDSVLAALYIQAAQQQVK